MKKVISLCALIYTSYCVSAQALVKRDSIYPEPQEKVEKEKPKSEVETLFQGQKSFGGYFAMNMGYTQIDENDAVTAGTRLMFVANHYLGIGFGGQAFGTASVITEINLPNEKYKLHSNYYGGYGGLFLEPVFYSLKAIHVSMPILLGAGGMAYSQWSDNWKNIEHEGTLNSIFFIVEPGLDVEFNIAKWFRIGLGASYRFTTQVDSYDEIPNNALQGFNYGITFKMGWF